MKSGQGEKKDTQVYSGQLYCLRGQNKDRCVTNISILAIVIGKHKQKLMDHE